MSLLTRPTSTVLLAAALAAQSPTPTTTAAPQGPPLVAKTSTQTYARALQRAFSGGAPAVEMLSRAEEGKHHVLTLDDTGKLTATTGDGDVTGLDLVARPAVLMRIFDKPIQRVKMQAEAAAKMFGGAQMGVDPGPIIAGMFAFPSQMDRLRIQADGNPMVDGLKLSIDMQPVADSGFARFASMLEVNQAGAPKLADADLSMRFAVAGDGLRKLTETLVPMMSSFGLKTSDEFTALMTEMSGLYNGCGGASFGFDGSGMAMAFGVDGEKAKALIGSERYLKAMKAAFADSPMFEEEPKFGSSEHRGVGITEVSMDLGDVAAQNPVFGGSTTTNSCTAIAGNLMLNSMGKDNAPIRGLIDAVMDKKVSNSPLPGGALLTMDLALAKVAQAMAGPQAEGAPEHVGLSLARSGAGLVLRIEVK